MDLFKKKKSWDVEADVVVIGSGAAGLTAALAAHDGGAKVVVLEKAPTVGGASAVSGGVVWVPNNHHMTEVGISDSRDDAVGYVKRLSDGRSDPALIETFLDTAPQMLRFVEGATSLAFTPIKRYPDYHPELPGGRPGGRSLDPGLFDSNELGPWKKKLRRSPIFGMTAMSVTEATDWGVFSKPLKLPFKLLGERLSKGYVCYGGALVGRLLKALLDRGVAPMLETAARELLVEEGRVAGVRVHAGGARAPHPRAQGGRPRQRRFRVGREARGAIPRRPAHSSQQPAVQRRRRPPSRDGARRRSREHERSVVVPVSRDPRRGVRRASRSQPW